MKRLTALTMSVANGLTLLLTLFWIVFQYQFAIPVALMQGFGILLLSTLILNRSPHLTVAMNDLRQCGCCSTA